MVAPEGTAAEIAIKYFAQRYSCSEAVLLGLAEANGFECGCIPRIASGFGGGFGGCGEVCGALTGAVMALGLKFGRERPEDVDAKNALYVKVRSLMDAFEKEFGSVLCIDLTECEMRTPEGLARAKELDLHNKLCPKFVEFAAETAQVIIEGS